jgi:hypothetical protein
MRKFVASSAVLVVLLFASYAIYIFSRKTPITVGDGSFILDPVDPGKWDKSSTDVSSKKPNVTMSSIDLWKEGCSTGNGWCKERNLCDGNCVSVMLVYANNNSRASLSVFQLNAKMHAKWDDPGGTTFSDFTTSGMTLKFDRFAGARVSSIEVNGNQVPLGATKNRVKIYFTGL